jgi:hypothetical protein
MFNECEAVVCDLKKVILIRRIDVNVMGVDNM